MGGVDGSAAGYLEADRQRWAPEDPADKRPDRGDFARDRARVVHSSALRRLAAKTQVVQPDTDDFVRNRLTHSLEVAQIGREFGAALGCDADVVDTACLAHDLGHPPFGHNGESALDELSRQVGGFEGNAQTLRLLTRLEPKRFHPDGRPAGLNLTRASLDASVKYPWARGAAPDPSTAKFGVYAEDTDVMTWIRAVGPEPGPRRCLEAQVMDWSDEVGYSVHDVEDAVAGGLLDLRVLRSRHGMAEVFELARSWYEPAMTDTELAEATARLLATGVIPDVHDRSRQALAALKDMSSALIGRFVRTSQSATRARFGPGRLTRYRADLVVPRPARAECVVLKALAARFVMTTPERLDLMARQREVVHGLVDAYQQRPEERLDLAYQHDYQEAPTAAARTRVVVDQVASLTDATAVALFARWCRAPSA